MFAFSSDLLRVSAKGKLIIDEGVLRQRDVFRCEIAAVALGKTVLDFLGYSDFKKVEIQNPFLIKVRSYLFELRSIILSAVNGLVSRRTIAIINSISNLLESSPFLNLFFYSPEADSSREYLHQTLLTLLGPLFKDQCRSSYRNSICSYDSSVHQSKEEEIAIEDSSDNAQYDHESSCTSLKGATASSVVEKRRSHQSSWIK